MQALVYIFIGLAGVAVGAAAYFGFTFTPIEALVTGVVFGGICVLLLERTLRQRAEARLEKGIEDLSRLLSTDAQAGATLSQRVNALADENAGKRLDGLEADISVLGTVVRQVAEAVADLEERRTPGRLTATAAPDPDRFPEPVIPLEMLSQAINEDRLVYHVQPIMQLPMRKPYGYAMLPRLKLEHGQFADPPHFMPRQGGTELVRRIETKAFAEAIVVVRRARMASEPISVHVPVSRAELADPAAVQQLHANVDANKAIAPNLVFEITQAEFRSLTPRERAALTPITRAGAALSLGAATSLRIDFAELQGLGFRSIGIDATRFLSKPETFTDFHVADVAAYARRYGIELIALGVVDEQQVLSLYEEGITLAQGNHLGATGPALADVAPEQLVGGLVRRRVGA